MWQKCPVCNGCGTVPWEFYHGWGKKHETSAVPPERETCRACGGSGALYALVSPPVVPVYPYPYPSPYQYPWPWSPYVVTSETTGNMTAQDKDAQWSFC